jgi:hypothetical protein
VSSQVSEEVITRWQGCRPRSVLSGSKKSNDRRRVHLDREEYWAGVAADGLGLPLPVASAEAHRCMEKNKANGKIVVLT